MNTLNDIELMETDGGFVWPTLYLLYRDTLDKIEKNPEMYTWTMDWYYAN
jgi:hypothetical protein